jgi:DtxR family Mn-dependent transcriptional regulator
MEDHLKAMYLIRERGEEITTLALAQALEHRPPSVTGMVKRLAELGMLEHRAYQPIVLTPVGEAVALEVVRHHRLLELYLTEFLGMPWEEVHAEADRLEHHISEDLEERIAARLGQPAFDPHGDPIPTRDLVLPRRDVRRLVDLAPGVPGRVARVEQQDQGVLRYLETIGLVPGAAITLVSANIRVGVVTVHVGPRDGEGGAHTIGQELAGRILVTPGTGVEATA